MNAMPMIGDTQPALHNCGPSPSSVYKTAPVGQVHALDLFGELQRSTIVPRTCRASFVPHMPRYGEQLPVPDMLPPDASTPNEVVQVVAALMLALPPAMHDGARPTLHLTGRPYLARRRTLSATATPCTEAEALQAVAQLAQHLARLGYLTPVYGLVSWAPRVISIGGVPVRNDRLGEPLPWLPAHSDEHDEPIRLAWMVCACSYAAPPLVLFSRTPSLRYWRADGALQLRWLGHAEARA